MLWSPIVKNQKLRAKHNQFRDVSEVKDCLKKEFDYELKLIINHTYKLYFNELMQWTVIQSMLKKMKMVMSRLI